MIFRHCIQIALAVSAFLTGSCARQDTVVFRQAMQEAAEEMKQLSYTRARALYEEALQLSPSSIEARVNLAIVHLCRGNAQMQDLTICGTLLGDVLDHAPENVRALYCSGLLCLLTGKPAQAAPYFSRVIHHKPNNGFAWYFLGVARVQQRMTATCERRESLFRSARAALERAIEEEPYLVSSYYVLQHLLATDEGRTVERQHYVALFQSMRRHPRAQTANIQNYGRAGALARVTETAQE